MYTIYLYIYVYIYGYYMHICTHTHTHTYITDYVHATGNLYIQHRLHTCEHVPSGGMHIYTHIYIHKYVYIYVYIWYVYIYVYIWYVYVYVYICSRHLHTYIQVFCSALPCTYCHVTKRRQDWSKFASTVLEGAFEGILCAAAILAAKRKHRVKVYLTKIGMGAFGNSPAWVYGGLQKALKKYAEAPLDVYMVTFGWCNACAWMRARLYACMYYNVLMCIDMFICSFYHQDIGF